MAVALPALLLLFEVLTADAPVLLASMPALPPSDTVYEPALGEKLPLVPSVAVAWAYPPAPES